MTNFLHRWRDAPLPYQEWKPFPPDAIVQVRSAYYPDVPDNIGPAHSFWWGYEEDAPREMSEGVIVRARRLDKPKRTPNQQEDGHNDFPG